MISSFFDRVDYGETAFGVEGNRNSVLVVIDLPMRYQNEDVKECGVQERGWNIFNRIISPECAGGAMGQL